ncbi:MAG: glycerophosphodiester phosphodiesterase family protein, partial [Bacteroidota bacterium]
MKELVSTIKNGFLLGFLALMAVQLRAQTTLEIPANVNLRNAFELNGQYGVAFKDGVVLTSSQSLKVSVFSKIRKDSGEGDDALWYGFQANSSTPSIPGSPLMMEGFNFSAKTYAPFTPTLYSLQNDYNPPTTTFPLPDPAASRSSLDFKVYLIKEAAYNKTFQDTKSIYSKEVPVIVSIEVSGGLAFSDIKEISLPGFDHFSFHCDDSGNCYYADFLDFFPESEDITVMAHRGYWEDDPENTQAAIDNVFQNPDIRGFEIDITMTADEVLFASHDNNLLKLTQDMGSSPSFLANYNPANPRGYNFHKDITWQELQDFNKQVDPDGAYVYNRYNSKVDESGTKPDDWKLWKGEDIFSYLKAKKDAGQEFFVGFDIITDPDYLGTDGGIDRFEKSNELNRDIFKRLVKQVTINGLNDRVLFKIKAPIQATDQLWEAVKDTLVQYDPTPGDGIVPQVFYMPILNPGYFNGANPGTSDETNFRAYRDAWFNEAKSFALHPYMHITSFEIVTYYDDNRFYTQFMKDWITEFHNEGFTCGKFDPSYSASFGTWSDGEEFIVSPFIDNSYYSFEWALRAGVDWVVSDYPSAVRNLNNRKTGSSYATANMDEQFSDFVSYEETMDSGFLIPMAIDVGKLTNQTKEIFAQLFGENNQAYWSFGIDEEDHFFIKRIFNDRLDGSGQDQYYEHTVLSPREAYYKDLLEGEKVFVAIQQTNQSFDLFVGTPDGRFDNFPFGYGFGNSSLASEWSSVRGLQVSDQVTYLSSDDHEGYYQALCHCDVFDIAVELYYKNQDFILSGNDYTSFSIPDEGIRWQDYQADK